jgi:hypothetical protein
MAPSPLFSSVAPTAFGIEPEALLSAERTRAKRNRLIAAGVGALALVVAIISIAGSGAAPPAAPAISPLPAAAYADQSGPGRASESPKSPVQAPAAGPAAPGAHADGTPAGTKADQAFAEQMKHALVTGEGESGPAKKGKSKHKAGSSGKAGKKSADKGGKKSHAGVATSAKN